jgi:hypothetical protein
MDLALHNFGLEVFAQEVISPFDRSNFKAWQGAWILMGVSKRNHMVHISCHWCTSKQGQVNKAIVWTPNGKACSFEVHAPIKNSCPRRSE